MFDKNHLIRQLALLLFFILAGGTFGYSMIEEGWSLFDGFYMTLITLTTIGFSEVHDLSTAGRILTVFVIVFGLGAAATILGQLAQLMMEGDIIAMWKERRMNKKIAKMKGHVIICGYGRIGHAICRDLTAMGVQCVVIERAGARVSSAHELEVPVLEGNATSDTDLLQAGIERAAILVAALSNDSDNLFVALAARDLNADLMVIARGEDKSIETRMLRAGVDRVVYPAQLGGGQIARLVGAELGHEEETDLRRRQTDVMGYELQIYRNFNKGGATVGEILERTGALRAVAHIDEGDIRHNDPAADHKVAEGEALILVNEVMAAPVARDEDNDGEADLPQNLSVGIPAIDEEHGRILTMIKKVQTAGPGTAKATQREVLSDLRDYTLRHFKHEEAMFVSAGFPEADDHIAEHRALSRKVEQLIKESDSMHPDNLVHLLDSWVRHHILEVDRRYMDFMAGREEGTEEKTTCRV